MAFQDPAKLVELYTLTYRVSFVCHNRWFQQHRWASFQVSIEQDQMD